MAVRFIKKHGQSLVAAVQFLTRVPIPVQVPFEERTLARSVIYFPLAGALIGIITACAYGAVSLLLPPLPAAVTALAVWIALSGGLHVDGWMDTADGVLSHRSREKMLEIMKDSRVGAMGVIAGVLLLLFKFALLAELAGPAEPAGAAGIRFPLAVTDLAWLAMCPVWSRWWMGAAIRRYPNARQGQGMGALFHAVRRRHSLSGFVLAVILTAAIGCAAGLPLLYALAASAGFAVLAVLAGLVFAGWLSRKLGGLTGDTYGALNEWVEAVLLAAVLAARHLQFIL